VYDLSLSPKVPKKTDIGYDKKGKNGKKSSQSMVKKRKKKSPCLKKKEKRKKEREGITQKES
jgi:hypothetical protein